MTKYKLEYIWLDGKKPVPELRGKTLLKEFEHPHTLAALPNWGFDGSSTMQAEGKSSDCVLKPVALRPLAIDDASLREIRGGRRIALQTHQGGLEWIRHALQL